ncbi:flagellar hook-associated protein FlgL [Desulfosarcina sp. OttesenSCG-928-G10]|nr:flagellar hook-associated protein FlgL [Desulfosarcina sp. OttesenSCG-928-G10]
MRVTTKMMADTIKAHLARQNANILKSEIQLATTKKINKLSDDPKGITQLLGYRTALSTLGQYQQNITNAKSRVEYTSTTLEQIASLVNDAKNIASRGTPDEYAIMADQVVDIRDQLMDLVNSQYSGSYLFSGNKTDTPAFGPVAANGDYPYQGDAASYQVMVGSGSKVSIIADGDEIFRDVDTPIDPDDPNDPGTTIFQMLDDLEEALRAGDEAAIRETLEGIGTIEKQTRLASARLSVSYSRLDDTQARWKTFSNVIEEMRADVEDADLAQTALELQLQQNNYNILLQVAANVIPPSLVDFLR